MKANISWKKVAEDWTTISYEQIEYPTFVERLYIWLGVK